jgi:hypothetical protein
MTVKLKHLLYLRTPQNPLLNENIIEGNDWFVHMGSKDHNNQSAKVSVYFTENNKKHRIWFEVNYNKLKYNKSASLSKKRENSDKWRDKAARTWVNCARKLHKEYKEITEGGNTIYRNWNECFIESLKDPKMQIFVRKWGTDSV